MAYFGPISDIFQTLYKSKTRVNSEKFHPMTYHENQPVNSLTSPYQDIKKLETFMSENRRYLVVLLENHILWSQIRTKWPYFFIKCMYQCSPVR